jgi:phage terminase large subunit-like protein
MTLEDVHCIRLWLGSLSPAAYRRQLKATGKAVTYDWPVWIARDSQLLPEGDWLLWLLCCGRGFGKTRTGSETIRWWVEEKATSNYALVAPTAAQARDVMVEGESGLLSVFPPHRRPEYEPSKCKITFHTGATAHLYSADEPDRLRGVQHGKAWADEVSTWRRGTEAWRNLLLGLRLGKRPQVIATRTPRPNSLTIELLKGRLVEQGKAVITRGSSHENRANLPASYSQTILSPYEGTRLGRQEIEGELLEDVPGALWTYGLLDDCRIERAPDDLASVVVAIDPAMSTGEDSNETGLIVVAKGADGHGYVLADGSGKYSPHGWAERAKWLKTQCHADRYVCEVNNGGDLVEGTLRIIDPYAKVIKVHASRGKLTRAEPVAALYEQRKVHHVDPHGDAFRILVDQMATFVPGVPAPREDLTKRGWTSPDRMDALVWGCYELFLKDGSYVDYSMFTRQLQVFVPPHGLRPWWNP